MTDRFDLTDRVAIVTGGGQGIGKTVAHAFAEAGANVVIAELNEDRGAAVEEQPHRVDRAAARANNLQHRRAVRHNFVDVGAAFEA